MNRPILIRCTGTPTARALAALPPTAKIQLPIPCAAGPMRDRATKKNHQITVIDMVISRS